MCTWREAKTDRMVWNGAGNHLNIGSARRFSGDQTRYWMPVHMDGVSVVNEWSVLEYFASRAMLVHKKSWSSELVAAPTVSIICMVRRQLRLWSGMMSESKWRCRGWNGMWEETTTYRWFHVECFRKQHWYLLFLQKRSFRVRPFS